MGILAKFYLSSIASQRLLQLFSTMEHIKKANKPKTYAKIPLEIRMKLVELINSESLSIAKAARVVSINVSTAKLILKKFKDEGTYFEKRSDKIARITSQRDHLEGRGTISNHYERNLPSNNHQTASDEQPLPLLSQYCPFGNEVPYLGAFVNGSFNFFWSCYEAYPSLDAKYCLGFIKTSLDKKYKCVKIFLEYSLNK